MGAHAGFGDGIRAEPTDDTILRPECDCRNSVVKTFLKPLGFLKKGRTHNRGTVEGLIHVVNFQMGAYPIGDHYVVPGVRESLYGKFAVNLGVLLPCVFEAEWKHPVSDFVQECQCTIRQRLGVLAFGEDQWFEIASDPSLTATSVVDLLERFGPRFFAQFQTYADVLVYYNEHGALPFQTAPRATLEAALIAHHVGNDALARSLFAKAYATDHEVFRHYVAELAERIGCKVE